MVGTANVQNCNVSSTCCDGYNATIGYSSCGTGKTVCAVFAAKELAYDLVINGVTRRSVPTNLPYSNGAPPEINIMTLEQLIANKGRSLLCLNRIDVINNNSQVLICLHHLVDLLCDLPIQRPDNLALRGTIAWSMSEKASTHPSSSRSPILHRSVIVWMM